jgi:predicted ATPase with chaperone activity
VYLGGRVIFIGDLLVAHGLVTRADVTAALNLQRAKGGALGACLVSLGKITSDTLGAITEAAPTPPHTIAETGLTLSDILNLAMKAMYVSGEATPSMISEILKLAPSAIQALLEEAEERRLVIVLGAASTQGVSELRYALSDKGTQWAQDAMRQNQYVGPAPVTLDAYRDRIGRQRIGRERIDQAAIDAAFGDLVISKNLAREIGPAINSGRSILLYGPPGNGKTSVGERIGGLFREIIYVPHCFEVDGQIIKVFDPGVHRPVVDEAESLSGTTCLPRDQTDPRWVACWRPLVITGGELTLEMLDLSFNPEAKFYEAPAHVKALGGVFMIDDFGRQLVSPTALLNRWIVPMENRVDYLRVHTGRTFSLPFDELVIFCTNMPPSALMDQAFLRRIPYKIEMSGPSIAEFREVFHRVSAEAGLEMPERLIDYVIADLTERRNFSLASYQPQFIVDQVKAACRFEGVETQLRPEFITMALGNLYTKDTPSAAGIMAMNHTVSAIRAA